ncbi:MAG: transposase [Bacteroidetes bacterium]|nr:transposase [Bacteroidota bacterium]
MGNKRKFTPEDRLAILEEGKREGHTVTQRKYNIAPSLYDRWRKKYLANGVAGLHNQHKRVDPQARQLEEENERLKKIVAKQALQIEVQGELLKKTPIGPRIK